MHERDSKTAGLVTKVKDEAVSQLNTQKDRTTDGIGSVVQAVRHGTEKLREEKHETIARYVDQAASQLDRFANHLKSKDTGQLLQDAQRYARRNPAVFIGSAFAIGLVAARFFKSSPDQGRVSDWREPAGYGGSSLASRNFATSPVGTSGATLRSGPAHSPSSAPGSIEPGQRTASSRPRQSLGSHAPAATPSDGERS